MINQTTLNTPFIRKLNFILSQPQYQSIIRWDSTGTMIDILDQKKIESDVLPKFFRHNKYQSFIRQLNLYGFRKIKKIDSHRFRHPDLIKKSSLFCIKSQRKNRSGIKQQKKQSTNLYSSNLSNLSVEQNKNSSQKSQNLQLLKKQFQQNSNNSHNSNNHQHINNINKIQFYYPSSLLYSPSTQSHHTPHYNINNFNNFFIQQNQRQHQHQYQQQCYYYYLQNIMMRMNNNFHQ